MWTTSSLKVLPLYESYALALCGLGDQRSTILQLVFWKLCHEEGYIQGNPKEGELSRGVSRLFRCHGDTTVAAKGQESL